MGAALKMTLWGNPPDCRLLYRTRNPADCGTSVASHVAWEPP
jgi:hypothetical protein